MSPVPGRVLVVDDEADVRLLLSRVLRDAGYEVDAASDGSEALTRMASSRPDLVVLDLMMPGLDGWGVLAELKKATSPPPVVLVTASADATTFGRGVKEGVAGYIAKPFRFRELLVTCERVIAEGRRTEGPPVERRRNPRRALIVEVRVLASEAGPQWVGELVDFGAGGAQIYLDTPVDVGMSVRLSLRVPGAVDAYSFNAVVRWRRETLRGFAHGLAFVGVDAETERRLSDLVRAGK